MKRFLVDQMLFLLCGIGIIILIPRYCGPAFSIFLIALAVLSWGFLCRRLLLMPLDFIVGKKTQTVFYATQRTAYTFEFFNGMHCKEWKFYFGNNQTIYLLYPDSLTNRNNICLPIPKNDEKVIITYYKHSKILLEIEIFET